MFGFLATVFYFLSLISDEIWFSAAVILPAVVYLGVLCGLSFTSSGRIIRAGVNAKRFIKKEKFITLDNRNAFNRKCLKILPEGYRVFGSAALADRSLKSSFSAVRYSVAAICAAIPLLFLMLSLFYGYTPSELIFRVTAVSLSALVFFFASSATCHIQSAAALAKWNYLSRLIASQNLLKTPLATSA